MNINTNTTNPIQIQIDTNGGGDQSLSLQILFICLPIVLAPLVGLISWFIRGYYDDQQKALDHHNEDKKKYLIDNLQNQIKLFYWPLYLYLIRYKQLVSRYKEFKSGHFSLSTGHSPEFLKRSPLMPQKTLNLVPEPFPEPLRDDIIIQISHLESQSQSNSDKDIPSENQLLIANPPKKTGMGFANAIKIINKFNKAIKEYENQMTQTLKNMQKIYIECTVMAEPSFELLRELVKLDEYITYIITFRDINDKNSSDSILEEKIEKAKFPDKLYQMIDDKLHYLQQIYNDLIANQNSSILNTTTMTFDLPTKID